VIFLLSSAHAGGKGDNLYLPPARFTPFLKHRRGFFTGCIVIMSHRVKKNFPPPGNRPPETPGPGPLTGKNRNTCEVNDQSVHILRGAIIKIRYMPKYSIKRKDSPGQTRRGWQGGLEKLPPAMIMLRL